MRALEESFEMYNDGDGGGYVNPLSAEWIAALQTPPVTTPPVHYTPPIYEQPYDSPPNPAPEYPQSYGGYDYSGINPSYAPVGVYNPPVNETAQVPVGAPIIDKTPRLDRLPVQTDAPVTTRIFVTKPAINLGGSLGNVPKEPETKEELLFGYPKNTIFIVGGVAVGGLVLWMLSEK